MLGRSTTINASESNTTTRYSAHEDCWLLAGGLAVPFGVVPFVGEGSGVGVDAMMFVGVVVGVGVGTFVGVGVGVGGVTFVGLELEA